MHVITAENYLRAHLVPNTILPILRIEDVGSTYSKGLLHNPHVGKEPLERDHAIKVSRKAVIKAAKLLHRFHDNIEKPSLFALKYLDGLFDAMPDRIVSSLYVSLQRQGIPFTENLTRFTSFYAERNTPQRYLFGDLTGDHILLVKIPSCYSGWSITIKVEGYPHFEDYVTVRDSTPITQWYA